MTETPACATVAELDAPPLVQPRAKPLQQGAAVRRMDLLEPWRLSVALPFVSGRLLDLACGYNNLSRAHGCGLGVDVFPWEGIDIRIGRRLSSR